MIIKTVKQDVKTQQAVCLKSGSSRHSLSSVTIHLCSVKTGACTNYQKSDFSMHKVIDLVNTSVCSCEVTDLVVVKEQVNHNGINKSHHQKRHTEHKKPPEFSSIW